MSSDAITKNDLIAILQELGTPFTPLDYYPIGSYYETSDVDFDPNNVWGGTWVLETEGQVHVSAGSNYPVNGATTNTNDGGNKDAIVPYHRHGVAAQNTGGMSAHEDHAHVVHWNKYNRATGNYETVGVISSTATGAQGGTDSANIAHTHSVASHDTNYAGTSGNTTDANMQPYIVVNRWHRTA